MKTSRKFRLTRPPFSQPDPLDALRTARTPSTSAPSSAPAAPPGNSFADVLEEARLIEWPSLTAALGDTALVVGIVAGSALALFAINSALTDLAKAIY